MPRLRRALTLLAALLCVAAGAYQAARVPPAREREPAWGPALAPLVRAPLPDGAAVALVAPARLSPDQADAVRFEAAWLRPDLRWAVLDRWPAGEPPRFAVVLGDAPPPPAFDVVWREGVVAVLARSAP